jgi:hypothetical protein
MLGMAMASIVINACMVAMASNDCNDDTHHDHDADEINHQKKKCR